jgi:hypothetical protein
MRGVRFCLLVLSVLTITVPNAQAQTTQGLFSCTTDNNHERWALKTRSAPASLASAKPVTLAQILSWAIPAGHTVADVDPIPPREPKLYTVTGFVRLI